MSVLPRRRLGQWGPEVSAVGLGMAALGRPGYINLGHGGDLPVQRSPAAMRRHAHAVLDAARVAGITYVDAARSYGLAEDFVASWLARRGAPEMVVGSKWGYAYTAGWAVEAEHHEIKTLTIDQFLRQLGETRERLGDRLALYQIHSATLASGVLDDGPLLEALDRLRSHGVLVGLTVTGPEQEATIRRALEVEVDGKPLFATVQATWNLLERSAGPALAEAHGAGRGVIVKEALANGVLTARNPSPPQAVVEAARSRNVTIDAAAIAAAVAQPWAAVVLSGAATADQLHSNLGFHLVEDAAEVVAETAMAVEEPGGYWLRRSDLVWN